MIYEYVIADSQSVRSVLGTDHKPGVDDGTTSLSPVDLASQGVTT